MKTSELIDATLDWAVAQCDGKGDDCEIHAGNVMYGRVTSGFIRYSPSTIWFFGGPIIEREGLTLTHQGTRWGAQTDDDLFAYGPTPLIAAMRCYVASKLGAEVEIPKELT